MRDKKPARLDAVIQLTRHAFSLGILLLLAGVLAEGGLKIVKDVDRLRTDLFLGVFGFLILHKIVRTEQFLKDHEAKSQTTGVRLFIVDSLIRLIVLMPILLIALFLALILRIPIQLPRALEDLGMLTLTTLALSLWILLDKKLFATHSTEE